MYCPPIGKPIVKNPRDKMTSLTWPKGQGQIEKLTRTSSRRWSPTRCPIIFEDLNCDHMKFLLGPKVQDQIAHVSVLIKACFILQASRPFVKTPPQQWIVNRDHCLLRVGCVVIWYAVSCSSRGHSGPGEGGGYIWPTLQYPSSRLTPGVPPSHPPHHLAPQHHHPLSKKTPGSLADEVSPNLPWHYLLNYWSR